MIAAWGRLPTIARAVILGSLVTGAGTLPWAFLARANLRWLPESPWSIPVMGLYLWGYWAFLSGHGWPARTSEWRRANLRARALAPGVWKAALLAGTLGWCGLAALRIAFDDWLALPRAPVPDMGALPAATVAGYVLMLSLVAGVAEEAGFRGYMQAAIERRHGPLVAILVAGCVFWLAHAAHYAGNARTFLLHAWFYLGASVLYGTIAYCTASILPCIVLHATADVAGVVLLAWLASSDGGRPGTLLPGACAAAAVFLPAAVWSGRRLVRLPRT